jgi:hypothetical protein
MTDFITLFTNFDKFVNGVAADNGVDDGVGDDVGDDVTIAYEPDFTLQPRPNSHTMRKCCQHFSPQEYIVKITRPVCTDHSSGVYVTDMDNHLSDKTLQKKTYGSGITVFSLHKKELYDHFIFEIEENCVEKTITYDMQTNMNKTKYKVPVIGMLVYPTSQKPAYNFYEVSHAETEDVQKFIMIRKKMYPIGQYFIEKGLEYIKLQLPVNYFSNTLCEDGEVSYCPRKTNYAKNSMTYSFHHDMKISSIIIRPELMKFKQVSSDNRMSRYDRANPAILRKKNYHINVLDNDPAILYKFELSYRSEQTDGRWVKHGDFNGNNSNIDFTKISFDEIMANEIRIIPYSFYKSFEHIRITFIGKCKVQPKSDELFVTYEVSIPRNGKYVGFRTKISDVHSMNPFSSEEREWNKFAKQEKKRQSYHVIRDSIIYDS